VTWQREKPKKKRTSCSARMMREGAKNAATQVWGGMGRKKSERGKTYLGAFTSAPLSMSNLTTMSLPPEQAAWRGSTPSMTELIG